MRIKVKSVILFFIIVPSIQLNVSCAGNVDGIEKGEKQIRTDSKDTGKALTDTSMSRVRVDTSFRLYLTFDDGPYQTTPGLSRLLEEKGVRASFFIVGSQVTKTGWHDSVLQAVASNSLFKVYNHTYSHAVTKGRIHRYYSKPDSVWSDILRNRQYLPKGVSITRLPGKNTWRIPNRRTTQDREVKPLLALIDSLGPHEMIVGWDFEWMLKQSMDSLSMVELSEKIASRFSSNRPDSRHIVLLSHDYLYRSPSSLSHLSAFIDFFKRKGNVTFDWVENIPSIASRQNSHTAGH